MKVSVHEVEVEGWAGVSAVAAAIRVVSARRSAWCTLCHTNTAGQVVDAHGKGVTGAV